MPPKKPVVVVVAPASSSTSNSSSSSITSSGPSSRKSSDNSATNNSSSSSSSSGLFDISIYERQLAFSEWIHDWWGGYRNKEGGQESNKMILEALLKEQPSSTPVDINTIEESEISKLTNEKMTEFYRKISPNAHITVSSIEESTIAAFEDRVPYLSRPSPNAIITYDDIFGEVSNSASASASASASSSTVSESVLGKITELRNNYRSITIEPGNYIVKELDDGKRKKIRDAIKLFMSGSIDGAFYLTFDAAGKDITKIFSGDDNTRALIMPANIADSATSSIRKLGKEENIYFFPEDTVSKRNTLTQDNYQIRFVNQGFSPLTPFSFHYVISRRADSTQEFVSICDSPFSPNVTQGPSLDTLMENHIKAYNNGDFRLTGSSGCLDIAKDFIISSVPSIKTDVKAGKSIFQSVKMCGDGDQVTMTMLATERYGEATVIFVSGDRQAVLTQRLQKGAAILHYNGTFTLYRTDKNVDPEVIATFNAKKDEKFVNDNTALFNNLFVSSEEGVNNKFKEFIVNISSIPLDTISNNIVRKLCELRLSDIITRLQKCGEVILNLLTTTPQPSLTGDIPADKATILQTFFQFETVGVPVPFLIALNNYKRSEASSAKHNYPFLKFSFNDYKELQQLISINNTTMNSLRPIRLPENYYRYLNQKDGYTQLLGDIEESFFEKPTDETLSKLTLPAPPPDQNTILVFLRESKTFDRRSEKYNNKKKEAIGASYTVRSLLGKHFKSISAITPEAETTTTTSSGGQRGGSNVHDVADVIREIANEASMFVNQTIVDIEHASKNEIITIANYDGDITVTSVEGGTEDKPRRSLKDLIDNFPLEEAHQVSLRLLEQCNLALTDYIDEYNLVIIKFLLDPIDGKPENEDVKRLMTLAVLNDIIEGRASTNISLFSALIMVGGSFPGNNVMGYSTFEVLLGGKKEQFNLIIKTIYDAINEERLLSKHTLTDIMSGGKRKNRKTRRRNNKKNNKNTTRLTRRRKH